MGDDPRQDYNNTQYSNTGNGEMYQNELPSLHKDRKKSKNGPEPKDSFYENEASAQVHPVPAPRSPSTKKPMEQTFTEIPLNEDLSNEETSKPQTIPNRYTMTLMDLDKKKGNDTSIALGDVVTVERSLSIDETKKLQHQLSIINPSGEDDPPKKPHQKVEEDYDDFVPLNHGLEDIPSWSSTWGLGFQVYLMMVATSVSLPIYIMSRMCMRDDDAAKASLVSTFVFVSGIITVIQTSFGTRLPIVQGGSSAFMIPTLAILSHERWKCPETFPDDADERTELWQVRMREIQGAIMVASIFQIVIGFTGAVGIILKYLTPITVGVSVSMIGLSLFSIAGGPSGKNWWIAVSTIILITLFSQYLRKVKVPIPFTKSPKREGLKRYQIFQNLPILLGMVVMWIICWILTVSDILPEGDPARTDLNSSMLILENSLWFAVPYPFQWGTPTVTAGAVFGILAGVISGIVESIGDYHATAKIVGARAPPLHAINRGIFVEGIGCVIAGIWGTGNGTTSYSENIGAIGITQIGSRRVIQIGGLLMIIFSLFCKLNAIFVTIPEPIVGAFLIVIFGTLTAAGLSNLKGVDLGSPRNMFVIGFSIFFALTVSQWMKEHHGSDLIKTGSENLDQMLGIFLSTGMFLGGFVAFLLDNTVPGSRKERGLDEWEKHIQKPQMDDASKTREDAYDLPFIMNTLHKSSIAKWVPISPTFDPIKYETLLLETFRLKGLRDGMYSTFNNLRHRNQT